MRVKLHLLDKILNISKRLFFAIIMCMALYGHINSVHTLNRFIHQSVSEFLNCAQNPSISYVYMHVLKMKAD